MRLGMVISPAEEYFWRGFSQDGLMKKFGRFWGWMMGTAAYGGVHIVQPQKRRSDHCRCILRRVIRARLSARRIGCQSHRLGQYHLPDRTNHQTGRRDLARLRLRLTRRAIINIQLNAKSSSYPITKERPNIFAPIIWDKALPAICRIIGDDPYLPYQNIDPRRICACMGYVLCLCTCKFALNLTHLHHLSCLKLTNPTKITA